MGTLHPIKPRPPGQVKLQPAAELDYEQAAAFLLELDSRTQGADLGRAMYLLGECQGHLADMVQLARALLTSTNAP
jgi:hypothetical protein